MKNTIKFLPYLAFVFLAFVAINAKGQIVSKKQLPAALQNGLVAFYPFNGNAGDSSGNGNHGIVNGAVSIKDNNGLLNGAFDFNGTSAYISLPKITSIEGNAGFTLAFKVNLSGKRKGGSVFNQWLTGIGGSGSNLGIQAGTLNATSFNASFLGGTGVNTQQEVIDTSRWSFVVFVFDGTQAISSRCRVYVNGVDKGYFGTSNIPTTIGTSNPSLTLLGATSGYVGGPITSYFDGKLDDIFIYNRSLTTSEANQLYTRTNAAALYSGITDLQLSNYTISENLLVGTRIGRFIPVDSLPGDFYQYSLVAGTGDADNNKFTIIGAELRAAASFDFETKSSYSVLVRAIDAMGVYPPFDKQVTINVSNVVNESIPLNGLVAYYPFNGNYNDESGNGNNGTANNITYGFDRFGKSSSSGVFTKSNSSYYFYPASPQFQPPSFTLSVWFKTNIIQAGILGSEKDQFVAGYSPNSWASGPSYSNILDVTDNSVVISRCWTQATSWQDNRTPTNTISANVWYNAITTYDSLTGKHKFYLNGVLIAERATVLEYFNQSGFYIGASRQNLSGTMGTFFDGQIDDVMFYNRALSSNEAVQLYTANGNLCDPSSFNPLQDTVRVCGTTASLNAGSGYTSYVWSTGATSQSINPTSSGYYKVAVTNSNGCSASDSTYLSLVKATIIPRDTTICKGSSIGLSIDTLNNNLGNKLTSIFSVTKTFTANWSFTVPVQTGKRYKLKVSGLYSDGFAPNILDAAYDIRSSVPVPYNICVPGSRWRFVDYCQQRPDIDQVAADHIYYYTVTAKSNLLSFDFNDALLGDNSGALTFEVFENKPDIKWSTGDSTTSISVSPTQSTIYYVRVSDGITSCSDTIKVNVVDTSKFNPFSDTTNVCGTSQSLSAQAGYASYSWNTGATTQSISPTKNGFYKVTAFNSQTCFASDSTYLRFFDYKIAQNDTTLNLGQTITLNFVDTTQGSSVSNLPPSAFQWSTGSTTSSINVKPLVSNLYYVSNTIGNTTCRDSINVAVQNAFAYNALPDTIKAFKDSVILDAGAGYQAYSWSDGSTAQTLAAKRTGTYKVYVTNGSGQMATDQSYVKIIDANIIQNDLTICKPDSVTLSIDTSYFASDTTIKNLSGAYAKAEKFNPSFKNIGNFNIPYGNVHKDYQSNIIVSGSYTGAINVDGNTTNAYGGTDFFIKKYDAKGNTKWIIDGGSTGSQDFIGGGWSKGVTSDKNGNIYFAGRYNQTLTIRGTGGTSFTGTYVPTSNVNHNDGFVIKLDSTGRVVWGVTINGASNDGFDALTVDPNGNIICLGGLNGCCPSSFAANINGPLNAITVQGIGYGTGILVKLSPTGEILWNCRMGNRDVGFGNTVTDADGNIYFTGAQRSWSNGTPGTLVDGSGASSSVLNPGIGLGFLIKLNANGVRQYALPIGNNGIGEGTSTNVNGIQIKNNRDIYISGSYAGDLMVFNSTTSSSLTLPSSSTYAGFVAKYSKDGVPLTVKQVKKSALGETNLTEIETDSSFVAVTGYYTGANAGLNDGTYILFDESLNQIRSKNFGGSIDEYAKGLAISNGQVFVTGNYDASTKFDGATKAGSGSYLWVADTLYAVEQPRYRYKWSTGDTSAIIKAFVDSSRKYFVEVTDGSRTSKDSVEVNIFAQTFNPLKDTLRFKAFSAELDAGAGFPLYKWSIGDSTQKVTVRKSGLYKVSVLSGTGCSATDSSIVSVFNVNILQNDTTICKGSSITLSIDSTSLMQTTDSLPSNLRNGLVAYYPFNGNANDESGNGYNATNYNANLTKDRFGRPNNAYSLNGTSSYLETAVVQQLNGASNFTMGLWVNFADYNITPAFPNGAPQFLISREPDGSSNHFSIYFGGAPTGENFVGQLKIGSTHYFAVSQKQYSVTKPGWHFVMLSAGEGRMKLYVDGLLADDKQFPGVLSSSSRGILLGKHENASNPYFVKGSVDDVFMYNRTLTESEISQIYNIGGFSKVWSTGDTTNSITVSPTQTTKYYATVTDGVSTYTDSVTVNVLDPLTYNPLQDTIRVCGNEAILDAGSNNYSYKWNDSTTSQTLIGHKSGFYKVIVNEGKSCVASDSTYVSLVNADIIEYDMTVCKGATVTLSVDSTIGIDNTGTLPSNLRNGLVAYYPFNGNANDESGNGNNGVINGATSTQDANGKTNGAYSFNGTNNTISLSSPFLGGGQQSVFSMSTRVKFNSLANSPNIWGKLFFWGEVNFSVSSDGTLVFGWANSYSGNKYSSNFTDPNTIQTGKWYDLAFVFENSVGKIYINGVPAKTNYSWSAQGGALLSTTQVESRCNFTQDANTSKFGSRINSGSQVGFLNGSLDEFAVYNRALLPSEVSQLASKGNSVLWSTGSSSNSITVSPTKTTKYYVTVSDGFISCQDSVTVNVFEADFNPFADTIISKQSEVVLDAGAGNSSYQWNTGETTQAIEVTQTGNYNVQVESVDGCIASDKVYVNLLRAQIIQSDTTLCKNDSITLTLQEVLPQDSSTSTASTGWKLLIPESAYNGASTNFLGNNFDPYKSKLYSYLNRTAYEFDLNSSTVRTIPISGTPSDYHDMVYDFSNERLLTRRAGRDAVFALPIAGGSWSQVGVGGFDAESYGCASYWNPLTNRIGFFGGYGFYATKNWIWENQGSNGWLNVYANNNNCNPAKRNGQLARNASGSKIYLFSGQGSCDGNQFASSCSNSQPWATDVGVYCWLKDLWEIDLSNYTFTNVLPINNSSVVREGSFAYDFDKDVFYNVGGYVPSPTYNSGYGAVADYSNEVTRFRRGVDQGFVSVSVGGEVPPVVKLNNYAGRVYYDSKYKRIVWARKDGIWAMSTEPSSNVTYRWSTGDTTRSIRVAAKSSIKIFGTVSDGINSSTDSISLTVLSADTALNVLDAPQVCSNSGSVRMQAASASSYKWLKDGVVITGATSSLYTATQTGNYRVVVANANGCTDTSRTVSITLSTPSVAGTISGAATVCSGANSTTLTLSGNTGTIQWQSSANNINFTNINAATAQTYTATNLTATTYYRAVVTNGVCSAANTTSATITVNPVSVAGTIAGAATVCSGTNSTTLTLSGNTGTVQWQSSANNINFTNIGGATAQTYTATNLTATTYYRAVVTSGVCSAATSTSATITVNPVSVAGTIAGAATVCSGTNSTTLTLSGNTGTVQWQSSANNINFTNIGGATAQTYTATNLTATTYYRAVVTSGVCSAANSASATVTVNALPTAPVAGNSERCGTGAVVVSATAPGGSVIDWYAAPSGGASLLSGSGSYTTPSISTTTTYYAQSRNTTTGCVSSSRTAVVATVTPISVAGTIAGAASVCTGTNSTTLTLSGNTGTIQWQSSTDNTNFTNINAATAQTYTATNLTATTYYRAVVTSGVCSAATSTSVTITVNPVSVAGTVSGAATVCSGTNSTTLTLSGNTGTIQWQSSTDNTNFTNINTATSQTYRASNLTATTYYRAVVTSGVCSSATTPSATITVNPVSVAGTISGAATVCTGSNSTTLTLSGNTGTIQWQSSTNNSTFTNIGGATSQMYMATNLTATTYYRAVVTSGVCSSVTSSTAVIAVDSLSVAGVISGSASVCTGVNSSTLSIAGNTGTIQWQSSPDSTNFTSISGATAQTYTAANLTATTYYRAVITSGVCSSVNSAVVKVTVNPLPAAPVGTDSSRCGTGSVVLKAVAPAGSTTDWYASAVGGGLLSGGSGTAVFTTPVISGTTTFYAQSRNITTGCVSLVRTAVLATVNVVPSITTNGVAAAVCYNDSLQLTQLPYGGADGGVVSYRIDWDTLSNGKTITDQVDTKVTLVQGGGLLGGILIPAGTAAGSYTGVLTLTNGVGCTLSRDIRVNINALPEVPKLLGGIGFCKGADMTLRTDGKGLLQWYKDGQELTGFNDSLLVIGKIGDYRVVTTNASGCVRSSELRKIVEHPVPVAGYGINDSLQCFNENRFVFSNGSKISAGDLLHVWSFGDSTYTTGVSPVHGYKGSGQYRVKLVSSSVYGCKDSVEKIVRVYDIPVKPQVNVVGSTSLCEGGLVYLLSTDALSYRWYRDGVKLGLDTSKVYRATAGGRYQLRVVNADGCESDFSDSVRVVVNPIPPVPEVTEVSLSYCISTNAVALKAKATSAKNTLLWYSPSSGDTAKVVVPVPSTVRSGRFDYYVSQRGDGGCESDKVRITVVVGSNGVKPSLNWDGGVLSTDTGYVSYEWLADGKVVEKGKSGMYRPKVAGLYRVLVTNLYGCVDTSGVYNLVVTAINNTAANSYVNMNIYPNPMRSKVTVDAGERPQKEYTIRVYDARGKTITTVLSKRQVTELNTSGMTSGQYMVEVSEGTKRKTMRVVKSE